MTSSATRSGLSKIKRSESCHLATPRVGCFPASIEIAPGRYMSRLRYASQDRYVSRRRYMSRGSPAVVHWRATPHPTSVAPVASVASHATREPSRDKAWRRPKNERVQILRSETCCKRRSASVASVASVAFNATREPRRETRTTANVTRPPGPKTRLPA